MKNVYVIIGKAVVVAFVMKKVYEFAERHQKPKNTIETGGGPENK